MKGKPAGLLLALGSEPDGDEPTDKPKGSSSLSAAKALLSAIKADDAEAADEALQLHYQTCAE